MEFLNKYQAVKHTDDVWSVVEVTTQTVSGAVLIASITMKIHNVPQDVAQELADDFNKECKTG